MVTVDYNVINAYIAPIMGNILIERCDENLPINMGMKSPMRKLNPSKRQKIYFIRIPVGTRDYVHRRTW